MINQPIFFERNRVGRVYTGGKLFAGFFGDEPVDGYEPEEWIASGVRAINKESKSPKEGISKIKDSNLYFDELLQLYPEELLGKGNNIEDPCKGFRQRDPFACTSTSRQRIFPKVFSFIVWQDRMLDHIGYQTGCKNLFWF